eukprot:Skav219527  [mRNA]  locus=scaffold30:393251:398084:+ [translate_table: standard]
MAASASHFYELPIATLRIFQRAVQCVAKLGKDAALIFQPTRLVLRGADDGHSSALHFVFGPTLFRSYDGVVGETKVVLVARQLLIPLSGSPSKTVRTADPSGVLHQRRQGTSRCAAAGGPAVSAGGPGGRALRSGHGTGAPGESHAALHPAAIQLRGGEFGRSSGGSEGEERRRDQRGRVTSN